MLRMPLIKMISRETHRLSRDEVRRLLGNQALPVETLGLPPANPTFYIYHFEADEIPFLGKARFHFFLVKVNGNMETILDYGEATAIRPNLGPWGRYLSFGGKGDKIRDDYEFWCPSPEGSTDPLNMLLEPIIGHFAPNGVKDM